MVYSPEIDVPKAPAKTPGAIAVPSTDALPLSVGSNDNAKTPYSDIL